MGLDHNRLTYRHHGRDETLTDSVVTDARVVDELLDAPTRTQLTAHCAGACTMPRYPPDQRRPCLGLNLARRFRKRPLEFITEIGRTYGDMAYFRMGPIRVYFVNNPQLIREVLVTKHKSFRRPAWLVAGRLSKIDGNGLVLSEGDFWLRQRRLVQPAFATKRFDGYAQATVEYTRRMLDRWTRRHVAGHCRRNDATDAGDHRQDVVRRRAAKARPPSLGEAVRIVSETLRRAKPAIPCTCPTGCPLPSKRRKRWAIRTLDDLVWDVIRQRRASGEDRGDLLSMLLLAVDAEGDGRGMSDVQARDEAMTLFNAGHDSTAAALAWIWYLVAGHPAVEARLVEEVDTVLAGRARHVRRRGAVAVYRNGRQGIAAALSAHLGPVSARSRRPPSSWAATRFPRRAWVVRLSLRHAPRPPVLRESRRSSTPSDLRPAASDKIPQYAYFPFGGGPRVCIGNTFATMEMILIVATVLQKVPREAGGRPGRGRARAADRDSAQRRPARRDRAAASSRPMRGKA